MGIVNSTRFDRQDEPLVLGRLVPVRREGKKVFARTLRYGEEDTGEAVHLEAGDQLIVAKGDFSINSRQIDEQSVPGLGGYAPVANTVYTWYNIIGGETLEFYLFFFSLARRIDAAHSLWTRATQERERGKEEGAIPGRIGYLNALASAEMAIIALHCGISMVATIVDKYCPDLEVPGSVKAISDTVAEMRKGFEHIDERAQGKVGRSGKDDFDALTIFDQTDFIESFVLRYKGLTLDFGVEILPALLDSRELIMNVIDFRASSQTAN